MSAIGYLLKAIGVLQTGVVVLCLYCYFFIFFFLVMLVAIQMVAYNKVVLPHVCCCCAQREFAWQVRHQFLVAGKRFLTLRQFCKLMMKRYRLAKIEVQSSCLLLCAEQVAMRQVEETHGGSWAKFFKLQLDDYYKENFADLSNNDVGDDNAVPPALNARNTQLAAAGQQCGRPEDSFI